MRTFFTSDTHFWHKNIIKYAKRPFSNIEEMNEALVTNWNAVVQSDDQVFHLGDFAFCPPRPAINILRRLKGNKHLIFGNHDKRLRKASDFIDQFRSGNEFREIEVEDQKITLCHYAMRVWNKSHYGAWQLYGHSHGSLPDDPHSLSLDVGVDCWNFTPVSFEEIKRRMKMKTFVPVDRHGREE